MLMPALLLLVQLLDIATTNLALHAGAVEANPLITLFMYVLGPWWWAGKLAVFAGACWLISFTPRPERSYRFALAVTGAAVVLNILNTL